MKKYVTIIAKAKHKDGWLKLMAEGVQRNGLSCAFTLFRSPDRLKESGLERIKGGIVVSWGWKIGRLFYESDCSVLVMEGAYVGSREDWLSLGWNGLNGRATFPQADDGGERWRRRFGHLFRPWRQDGAYSLIIGQVDKDIAVDGVDLPAWYAEAAATLQARFGLPVRFRPHPRQVPVDPVPPGTEMISGTLEDALRKAAVVATYNSSASVLAAIYGIPVIACDQGSMAWPVAAHGLEAPLVTPDRDAWCRQLAWCQWARGEISSGRAWRRAMRAAPFA